MFGLCVTLTNQNIIDTHTKHPHIKLYNIYNICTYICVPIGTILVHVLYSTFFTNTQCEGI